MVFSSRFSLCILTANDWYNLHDRDTSAQWTSSLTRIAHSLHNPEKQNIRADQSTVLETLKDNTPVAPYKNHSVKIIVAAGSKSKIIICFEIYLQWQFIQINRFNNNNVYALPVLR